jgi:DNA-binding transcriptional MerR regulator
MAHREQGQTAHNREEERKGEPELISKKEVLERTGISYGQFYRWKRKGLIPESWFIRKSTFTGQETFLPRAKILERIELIKKLKDDDSLEEIAEILSQEPSKRLFDPKDLRRQGRISKEVMERFQAITGCSGPYRFREVFQMAVLERLDRFELEPEEVELTLATLGADHLDLGDEELDWTLWLIRKGPGVSFCCLAPRRYVRFDPKAEIIVRLDLNRVLEATKMGLREI